MNFKKITVLLGLAIFTLTSCDKEEDSIIALGKYENGIIVTHQGNFGGGNASISYVSYDFGTIENKVFENINNKPLGDVAQSMAFQGDLAYIVVNGSNKIEIVNRYTFKSVKTIEVGLSNPRYIAFANGKGYVTNWATTIFGAPENPADDYIAIIDLETNTLESKIISVPEGPENILAIGNKVYVAHQGGWGVNNKISVIDATTDALSTTITVGDVPNSLQVDPSGNLWVLCSGKEAWTGNETLGQLFKISTTDFSVTTAIDFAPTKHPNYLLIENNNLYYYVSGSVYKMDVTANQLPTNAELTNLNFSAMSIKNGILYGVDAADYTSNGYITSYNLITKAVINTATIGIIPGAISFN